MLEHRTTFGSLRSHRNPFHSALIYIVASGAFACSGADVTSLAADIDSDRLDPPAPLSAEEREAQFQRLQAAPLSQEDRLAVEERLSELGIAPNEVEFSGRLAAIGDAYLDLDSLLGPAPEEIEKGRTFAAVDTRPEIAGLPIAPVKFSQIPNGTYQWMRPDISSSVSIVIQNGAAASFLISVFQQAAANIAGAANDCLTNTTFIVRTQADYDALSFDEKNRTKPIFVNYGSLSTTCPAGTASTNGCSIYPRKETRDFDFNVSSTRLVPGSRIGIVSSRVTTNHPNKLGIVTHELLHTLGLGHIFDSDTSAPVVGTQSSRFTTSVMQEAGNTLCTSGCLFVNTPSADDIDTIDTLYSQQSSVLYPGGDFCQWRDGMKNIAAN